MYRYRLLPVLILFVLLAMLYAIPAYGAADEYLADLDSTKQNGDTHASPFFPSASPVTVKTPALQPPGNCEVGLDVYFVVDASDSMVDTFANGVTKMDAAKQAISETVDQIADWNNGTQVGLIGYFGNSEILGGEGMDYNPFVPLTTDYESIEDAFQFLQPNGSTPTAHGLRFAADQLFSVQPSTNIPVIILLTDGLPTMSYEGVDYFGYNFMGEDVENVIIRDGSGTFLSSNEVRQLGESATYGGYGVNNDGQYEYPLGSGIFYDYAAGKPLADVMDATIYAMNDAGLDDLEIHSVAIQGQGSTFEADILEYVATVGNGVYASPTDLSALQDALEDAVQESSGCLPPSNECEVGGLDVYYLLDLSGSMDLGYGDDPDGNPITKLEAATEAIRQTNELIFDWNNGTRVGLLTFYGSAGGHQVSAFVDQNLEMLTLRDPLDPDNTHYNNFLSVLEVLGANGTTPTSTAIEVAYQRLGDVWDSNHKPVIILITDGVPSVNGDNPLGPPNPFDYDNYSGYLFNDVDVQEVDIRDGMGGFHSIATVRADGDLYGFPPGNPTIFINAGDPLADAMEQAVAAMENGPTGLVIHGVAIQSEFSGDIFDDGLIQYIANQGNGVYIDARNLTELTTALQSAAQSSGDCPPLPVDQSWSQGECPFCGNDERQQFVGPINTFSGNYNYVTSDISVPTLGTPLRFDRSYNSSPIEGGVVYSLPLGYGWTHNYNVRLVRPQDPGGEPETIILQGPRGSRMRFADNGGGSYSAYPGIWSEMVSGLVSGNTVYTVTAANQEIFIFNASGQLTRHEDPQGNQREFSYTSGLLTEVLDPETARDLTIAYDGEERITSVTDHTGRKVEYDYDGNGDLIVFTDTRELPWEYAYTEHRLIEIEDPENDILESIGYDGAGRATTVTDGEERIMAEIDYEPEGSGLTLEPTRVITQQGTVYTATYNTRNLIASVELADGQETVYGHDYYFNTSQTYDGLQNPTVYERNPFGQPLTVTDALDHETFYEYDSLNHLTALTRTITDGQVMTTTYLYDPDTNRMTRMTDSLGYTTIYTYNTVGDLIAMKDPLGRITSYGYDDYGNLTETVDALLNVTTFEYDELGRVITTTDALTKVTVNDYDPAGNLVKVTENFTTAGGQNYLDTYNLITRYKYDGVGRQTLITDTLGMVTKYGYDDSGLLITATVNYTSNSSALANTYNLKTVYGYDEHGRQSTVKDPLGYISYTGYNEQGRVVCVIINYDIVADEGCDTEYDPDFSDKNLITLYDYDLAGNRSHVTDPLGRVTYTTYDELNRTASVTQNYTTTINTDPDLNLTTVYTYNDVGNVVLMSDPLGRVTQTEYDKRQQPITITLNYTTTSHENRTDISVTTVYTYDAVGNRTVMTDAEGRPTAYKYDKLNRVEVITDALEGLTFYQYDGVGNQVVITDAEGRATFTEYDSLYRPLTVTRNFITNTAATTDTNITTTYTYDARGNRVTQTDALGRVTLWQYDSLGRVITTTANVVGFALPEETDVNLRTVVEYDALSRRVEITDPRNYTTTYAYDGVGRLITTTNALNHETVVAYDGLGNRLGITNAEGEITKFAYDRLNRLAVTTATIEVGEVMTTGYTYDKVGNRLTLRDGEGVVTCYGYDLMDRLTSVTENCLAGQPPTHEVNVSSEYGYDYIGNRVVFTNARNYTTTYEYDTLNRLITETDALDHITLYEYDAVGNRTVMTDAAGQVTEFAYDGVYRVDGVDYSNSTIATADVIFDYDALGNRVAMTETNGTGVTTYAYDRANRLTLTTNGANQSVGYGYDVMGNRTSLTNGAYSVGYQYDELNRLEGVTNGGSDHFDYTYDDAGRLTTLTYPNGVATGYQYDEAGRLIELEHTRGTALIARYEYDFDHANNRERITETVRYPYEMGSPFGFNGESGGKPNSATPLIPTLGGESEEAGPDKADVLLPETPEATPIPIPIEGGYGITWTTSTPWLEVPGAYQANNEAHQLRVYFTPNDVRLVRDSESTPGWYVGLNVSQIGYGTATIPLSVTSYSAEGTRMEYHRALPNASGEVVEWYINSAAGLKQGFTLDAAPGTAPQGEPLVVELTLSGENTVADLVYNGTTLEFRSTDGVVLFRYSGLYVYDANGQPLTATLEPVQNAGRVVGVRIEVEDAGATYPITIDPLLNLPAWVATSPTAADNARYGHSVSSAGDVNGDGYDDILVGAPNHDINGNNEVGAVFLYMGSAEGVTTTAALTLTGEAEGDHFGTAIATIGDLNGDGDNDILIGAPGYDGAKTDIGKVYVYESNGNGSLETTPLWTWEGSGGGDAAGSAVAGLRDVNNDDIPDIAIGIPYDNSAGRVVVFYGASGSYPSTPSWSVLGGQSGAQFGQTVAAAGDVNNDGINDLLVGAPYHDDGQTDEGKVFAWYGSSSGLGTSANWSSQPNQANAHYGASLNGAGDVNLDGYDDVVIGAPEYDGSQTDAGRAVVYHGGSGGLGGSTAWTVTGTSTNEQVGIAVAGAGDVNEDQYADVIVGANNRARLYHGDGAGLLTSAAWDEDHNSYGAFNFGFAVASAGDVNQDGASDVIVGSPTEYTFLTAPGYAYLYHGQYDFVTRVITYTYDPLYRLTEAEYLTGEFYTYTYDAVGNRESFSFDDGVIVTSEYTYNAVNWLTEVDDINFIYDLNGNLLEDSANQYFYDGANRLTQVTDGVNETIYTYDGIGNRVVQSFRGQETNYTLDVAGGLPEVILAGNTRYLQVGGQVLAQTEAGNWQYIQPDHLGSVRHLTGQSGSVLAYNDHDPFGNPVATYGAESAFGYTGEQEDESGLLFLRARYYDAETGRFLSQDPWMGNYFSPITLQGYAYSYQNPPNYVDPTGFDGGPASSTFVDPARTIIITCSIAAQACIQTALAAGGVIVSLPVAAVGLTVTAIALPVIQCTNHPELCVTAAPPAVPAPTVPPMVVPSGTPGAREILPMVVAPPRILPMVVAPQPDESPEPKPQPRIDPVPNPTAICEDDDDPPQYLYHYTSFSGLKGILDSEELWASNQRIRDAHYGNGQYLTDISPIDASTRSRSQLAFALFRQRFAFKRVVAWVQIDVTGLPVQRVSPVYSSTYGEKYFYLHASQNVLSLVGRIVASGITQFKE